MGLCASWQSHHDVTPAKFMKACNNYAIGSVRQLKWNICQNINKALSLEKLV